MPSSVHACLLLAACLACPPLGAQTPARVASMNLCSDQLLLLLADRGQIVSLSYLAADPAFSAVADRVGSLYLNHGQAEELLPLRPDLVVTGSFSATLAANLLERLGVEVLRLPVANSLEQVYGQIATVARATGNTARGEQEIAALRARITDHTRKLRPLLAGSSAVFLSSNGFSYGRDTLQDDFLRSLGMENVAGSTSGPVQLPLELLVRREPDYVFVNPPARAADLLAHPVLEHPALAAHADRFRRIELADAWFQCATPLILEAYAALSTQIPG